MSFLRRHPLNRQVVAIASVLLLLLLAAILWSARQSRIERLAELHGEALSVAVSAAASLDECLHRLDAIAPVLIKNSALVSLDRAQTDQLFAEVLHDQPLLTNVLLVAPDGAVRASGLGEPSTNVKLVGSWPSHVVQTGVPQVGEFGMARAGTPTVAFAYPVVGEGRRVVGALGLLVDLTRLQAALADIPLPADSVVTVVDRSNRILIRSREANRFVGSAAPPLDWSGLPRTAERTDVDGTPRITGDVSIKRAPWLLTVGIPEAVVLDRLLPLWQRNVAIALGAIVGFMWLSLWFAKQTSAQLAELRSGIRRIANGDLSPPSAGKMSNLEFAQLHDEFVQMAANLQQVQSALDRQVTQERTLNDTLQSLQRQVVRQERLAAVGLLASGVAHEVNNPLQAMVGAVELLERQDGLPAEARDQIQFVKTQMSRAREVVRSLSRFSSQQIGPPAPLDVNDVMHDVLRLRAREIDTARIIVDLRVTTNRRVYANVTELEKVTSHLLLNAIQAVESKHLELGSGRIEIRAFDSGNNVRVEIHDNGHGVELADEPKLFQPFFTTRKVGTGSGLGLSISYGIIESYGGDIGYFRNPWGGATFFYELAALDESSAAAAPQGRRPS